MKATSNLVKKRAKKSTANIAVLHKITMDRQGKCTGSEKTVA
ncbi:hypothetical protein B194_4252 [Serratia plymuthica A30]|nr:hypothetical protein B194_4252 [Serratia plymuthica A30]